LPETPVSIRMPESALATVAAAVFSPIQLAWTLLEDDASRTPAAPLPAIRLPSDAVTPPRVCAPLCRDALGTIAQGGEFVRLEADVVGDHGIAGGAPDIRMPTPVSPATMLRALAPIFTPVRLLVPVI
jgi:hypothetical protein